jgi:hypothetical protein
VHVITKEEIAVIAVLFVVSLASTLSRTIRDGDRRSHIRLLGLGFTSGFLVVGLYCVGCVYVRGLFGAGANLFWIGVASLIGFTAHMQDKIGAELIAAMFNKILGGTIAILSSFQKKNDNDK